MTVLPDPADAGRLTDIVIYGERAIRHLGDMEQQAFEADEKTYDSTVRCLAVVGEAAYKLSKPFQQAHPGIPWILVAAMRHRLVHDYGSVDVTTIYRVLKSHLPKLIADVQAIIALPRA
ncbi:hypothetical protein LBMAG53_02510 [Planctomycetota bacterium]|nr:hypothetical protein LBMAG53_02510 [Planctomycetota bacterium]